MKQLSYLLILLFISSCFPISIPPNLENGKLMEAKKFKRKLPNQYAYIFTDLKDANEFYYYLSAKFPPNKLGDSEGNVPITIDNRNYYISFYETEKKSRLVSLLPIMVNGLLDKEEGTEFNEILTVARDGTWYIALTVSNKNFEDGLSPNSKDQKEILNFVKALHNEYITTHNYNSLLLKK